MALTEAPFGLLAARGGVIAKLFSILSRNARATSSAPELDPRETQLLGEVGQVEFALRISASREVGEPIEETRSISDLPLPRRYACGATFDDGSTALVEVGDCGGAHRCTGGVPLRMNAWFAERGGLQSVYRPGVDDARAVLEVLGDHRAVHVDLAAALLSGVSTRRSNTSSERSSSAIRGRASC